MSEQDETDRCYHGRYRIDPCIGCGRRYVAGMLVGAFLTDKRPWSSEDCEVCEGAGAISERYNAETHDWESIPITVCWYCKGAGWYEAAL